MRAPAYDRRFLPGFLHELSRRNCPAYPEREWFAALASADREAPCNEPALEKPVLGPKQVWNGSSNHWSRADYALMSSVGRACCEACRAPRRQTMVAFHKRIPCFRQQ